MFPENIEKADHPYIWLQLHIHCFLADVTSVLTTFAILVQLVTPITNDRLSTFAFPRIACRKITKSRLGMLSKISVILISNISSHSGARPLTVPKIIAIPVDIIVATNPINNDCRPPYHIMEKISLPMVSVPNRNSLHGATV